MSHIRSTVLGVSAMVVLSSILRTAQGEAALPQVLPTPQHMTWAAPGKPGSLATGTCRRVVIMDKAHSSTVAGIEQVNARLAELKKPTLELAEKKSRGEPRGTVCLTVEPSSEIERLVVGLPKPKAEGYRLVVTADGVAILGKDVSGLYYGLTTLRQLIQPDGRIPCVAISDWPDLPVRGTYIGEHHFGDDPRKKIPYLASLKLNLVVLEYYGLYRLDDPKVRARWQDLFALCRKHCIEPVPELQSLGWGHMVLSLDPRTVEGVTLSKQPFEAKDGRIVPGVQEPAPPIALVNPGFEQAKGNDAHGWGQDTVEPTICVDKADKHSGTASLRLTRTRRGIIRAWQDVACLPNQGYEIGCYLKTRDIKGSGDCGAYIEVYGLHPNGGHGALLAKSAMRKGSQAWRAEHAGLSSGGYQRLRVYVRIQDATGTAWFDDVSLVGTRHAPADPLRNVIITQAAPLTVANATGTITYEAGKDYRVVPGDPPVGPGHDLSRTSYPASAKPLSLTLLPGSRIRDGDKLLVSFTYAPQGSITCCPSEPLYREVMRKSIQNVVRYLEPKYIHIGHDEPRVFNRDDRCKRRGLSNTELFVDDIKRMRQFAREADPNVRLMMWADAVNPYHNEPHAGMKKAAQSLPRDIVMSTWFYSSPQNDAAIRRSVAYFTDLGFDVTGSPWFQYANAHTWAQCLSERRKRSPHALGEIYTSWKDNKSVDPWQALTTTAEYAWSASTPPFDAWMKRLGK